MKRINYEDHAPLIEALLKRQDELNITHLAKELCVTLDLEYTDSLRRGLSGYLRVNMTVGSKPTSIKPKVLVFDLETSPIKAWAWGVWQQNIMPEQIIQDWHLISWAAKWLFEDEVMSDVLTPDEILRGDDSRIAASLWDLMDEADVIIAHNGDKFDIPSTNTRFIINGLGIPSSYISIDTLKIDRRMFRIVHNKLDYVNKVLGLDQKKKTGWEVWEKCMAGDQAALDYMAEYNREDVRILEQNYLITRPYIKNHPNLGLFMDSNDLMCPTCTSTDVHEIGLYTTTSGQFPEYRCNECGSTSHGRFNQVKKDRILPNAR